MSYMHRFVLASVLVATVTSASAQSLDRFGSGQSQAFRYNTVTVPDVRADALVQAERRSFGRSEAIRRRIPLIPPAKVIIVDNRTGDLWAWSEVEQTVLYLGYIFPLSWEGSIARVITVLQQKGGSAESALATAGAKPTKAKKAKAAPAKSKTKSKPKAAAKPAKRATRKKKA